MAARVVGGQDQESALRRDRTLQHGDHAEMPLDVAPSHLQLICDCRCHSNRVPMRRICEDGVISRDIFGDRRVVRASDGIAPTVEAFFSNKRGAER